MLPRHDSRPIHRRVVRNHHLERLIQGPRRVIHRTERATEEQFFVVGRNDERNHIGSAWLLHAPQVLVAAIYRQFQLSRAECAAQRGIGTSVLLGD